MNILNAVKKSRQIGGYGGGYFETTERESLVSEIRFFYNSSTLRGIEVIFANNKRAAFGCLVQSEKTISFAGKDIAEIKAYYSDFSGGRCKGVSVKTKGGKEILAGNSSNEFITVKDCKLLGVFGRSGADIDALGFIYLDLNNIPKNFPMF